MKFYKETNFKETPIGKIPKDWTIAKLSAVLNLRNGQRPVIIENGKFPVFGANGVMGYTDDFLTDEDFTLVIGRVGASGKVHLGKGKIWVSDNAIYSVNYDRQKINMPFLYYLLQLTDILLIPFHLGQQYNQPYLDQLSPQKSSRFA